MVDFCLKITQTLPEISLAQLTIPNRQFERCIQTLLWKLEEGNDLDVVCGVLVVVNTREQP